MKRTLKYALSAILTAAIVLPAVATTDNFPDVPDNHWAFEALQRLKKDGLLVGYPDGLFRGNRPASRYELAVAIHACYTNLKSVTDGLDSQIKALSDKLNGVATTADVQNLRDALTALQNDVNGMKSYGEDIAQLKKLAGTFEKELTQLGVDVEALKAGLGELGDRVSKLEKKKPTVAISGDVNLLMLGGISNSGRNGLSQEGYLEGAKPGTNAPTGIVDDLSTMEEGAFTFAGTNTEGPKWKGTVVLGNILDTFGAQEFKSGGAATGYVEGKTSSVYLQDFSVKFDSSIAGLGFNAELGRVGYKVSPYIFQRIDASSYYTNDRWNDGLYRFDGGIVGFNFGTTKLNIFAGNDDNVNNTTGVIALNTINTGKLGGAFFGAAPFQIDRTIGANLKTPLTSNGSLNLAYLILDNVAAPAPAIGAGTADRLQVYGGDLNFTFGKVAVSGGWSKSDLDLGTQTINNQNNAAWYAKVGIGSHKWGLNAGYREVAADYIAPGDWGRLGIQRNPTNIKGWLGDFHYDLSNKLKFTATGEFDKGLSDTYGISSGYDSSTKIYNYSVGLSYQVNTNLSVSVGYEDDEFAGLSPAFVNSAAFAAPLSSDASYKWSTFGIGYGLSETAKLSIMYQVSDISGEFQANPLNGISRYTGGLLTTQLSIKF